jgi:hypothetical protein
MSDGFVWAHSPDEVFPAGMDEYLAGVRAAILQIAQRRAPEIEAWMKANAPWTDRTGNARQTLSVEVRMFATQVVIWMSHGVTYGKYLELAYGGQYAVIGPALDQFAPAIWNDVEQLLR